MSGTTHGLKRTSQHLRRLPIPRHVEPLLRKIGQVGEGLRTPAYAVGGCVRDWLLGHTTAADVDVAVEGSGADLAREVARALNGTAQVHPQFGTATITLPPAAHRNRQGNAFLVDVAMCRRETYVKPAAYPKVAAGTLDDDLLRRDFTINAMAVALAPARFGELRDPYGGFRDLRRGQLRVLHARSFFDDPSRILRGIRFMARFGLGWEQHTLRALQDAMAAGALGWLNQGRLRKELERMCREPDPLACFQALATLLTPLRSGARG